MKRKDLRISGNVKLLDVTASSNCIIHCRYFGTANRFLSFFDHFSIARNNSVEWTWFAFPINNWHILIDIIVYLYLYPVSLFIYIYTEKKCQFIFYHFLHSNFQICTFYYLAILCVCACVRMFTFDEHSIKLIHGNRTQMWWQSHKFLSHMLVHNFS